ncbi:anti-sigma factor domain-containing protein [Pseudomonas sp. xss_2]|uniref:anti-sigma factor n=1 Tax=Pseudomonas sp. xss_2 TaxID=3367215 RepID=UPI00370AE6BE
MTTQNGDERPDELQQLAGEYVLGTLPGEQQRAVQARLQHDPALRAAVDAWEQRLLELTTLAEPQQPSPQLRQRIERSLDTLESPAPSTSRQQADSWWNLLPLWRGLAGAGLLASLLMALALLLGDPPPATPTYLVVLVAPHSQAPGWVVQASDRQQVQLIPLGETIIPADKALQFWTKADHWQAPVSLGLVKPGQTLSLPLDKLPPLEANQLFELTLEGVQGSPTGKPTGPIQFIGRAVKVI